MFRGFLTKATPIFALTALATTSLISLPSVEVSAVDTTKANPNYFYDRETAFIINNAIDFENGGMYIAVNEDGSTIDDPIPESVWGYEPNTIPGVYKSHIGQATCIRYLITEYQRTSIIGVEGVNDLLNSQSLNNAEDLLGLATTCADFIIDNMVIDADDNVDGEETQVEVSEADQGETSSPYSLYYWGVVNQAGTGNYFDDTAGNSANGVSRSESVIPWTLAELALAIKEAGFDSSEYLPYQDAAIEYFDWRASTAIETPPYSGNNFDPLAGRDFYYGALGFTLSELTGNSVYRDGDGSSNADGTPLGAIPFMNEHIGTGEAPDLAFPPTNSLQEGAYIGAYGRGVPFIKHRDMGGDVGDRDQWWDFGHDPTILQNGQSFDIRGAYDGFYNNLLDTPFAHYRGRELLAGVQRAQWFFYTNATNENMYYIEDNTEPQNLSTDHFGQKTVEYWNYINDILWDDTPGQEGWLEAVGYGYKPCFSGGNDVPIGDWLAPTIGNKIHTINPDDTALVTVSDVTDDNTPYLSWEFSASGINKVEVEYTFDDGATWVTIPAEFDGTNYVATIPEAPEDDQTVYYYAKAMDNFNNWTAFPEGAEEWDNEGNSLGKFIENSQLYNLSDPQLIDFQGTSSELPVEEVEVPEDEEETTTVSPINTQGGEGEPINDPVTIATQDTTGAGGSSTLAPLIRTGGFDD